MSEIERRDWEFDDDGLAVETRADGAPVLTGFAVKYGTMSVDLGGFREQILPGAFDKILSRSYKRADVVALYNHNADLGVLGRTSSGTLELESNDKGLMYRVVLPNTELGRMVQESVARRDLRGSSFAFTVDTAGESWGPGDDGKPVRSIREASGLFDVSVVTHPAYPSSTTSVARRSLEAWLRCQQEANEAPAVAKPDMRSAANAVMRLHAARLRSFLRGHKR
jgi:HK97 family phage prohead protease